jgi:hypothetical protein
MSICIIFIKLIRDPTSTQKPLPAGFNRSHNNMPLNLLYMIHKNLFYCFKTSEALCWFEMCCYDIDLSMLMNSQIPQLDLPQKSQYQAISWGRLYKNPNHFFNHYFVVK